MNLLLKKDQQRGYSGRCAAAVERRYFGQTIRSLNSFDDIAITFVRNYFDQTDFFVSLDILDKICLEDDKVLQVHSKRT